MFRLLGELAWVAQGALLGAVVAAVAGVAEFLLLYPDQRITGEVAGYYVEIVGPYALLGLVVGSVLAPLVHLRWRRELFGARLARLATLIVALVLGGYLVVWITYVLGPPLIRIATLAAWAAATACTAVLSVGLARTIGPVLAKADRRLTRTGRSLARWSGTALTVVGVLLGLPAVGAGRVEDEEATRHPAPAAATSRAPNVVFVLVDALRADHLPIYGYSRQTAPNLTALAGRSRVFTRAYAATSWTQPSIATIFSSLYPAFHGVVEHGDVVPDRLPLLAERMRAAGYRTFGISANPFVSPTFGYHQGFDDFWISKKLSAFHLTVLGEATEQVLGPKPLRRVLGERHRIVPRADVVTDVTLRWATANRGAPFFLYAHYIDPHEPYRAPAGWRDRFDHRADPPRRDGLPALDLAAGARARERLGAAIDRYDEEILFADEHIGRLLRGLQGLGVLDNAIVIVTADHGDEFGEHGVEGHRKSLYDGVLRVPLVVSWPGRIAPGREDRLVGLVDVMPTLLGLVGAEKPGETQGVNLAGMLTGRDAREGNRRLFAHLTRVGLTLEMVRDDRFKLIRRVRGPQAGREEVYDVGRDPHEREDLARRAPGAAAALRRELDAFNALAASAGGAGHVVRAQKIDRDTERALRSLGYVD